MKRYSWAGVFPGSHPVSLEMYKESSVAFPLQLQQQIRCLSYLGGNM